MGTWEQQKSAGNSEKNLYNLRNPFNLNYRDTLNKHVDEEDWGTVAIRDTPTQKKGWFLLYVVSDDKGVDKMAPPGGKQKLVFRDHVDEEDKTSYLIQVSGFNYKAKTQMITEERGLKFQLMQTSCVRGQY